MGEWLSSYQQAAPFLALATIFILLNLAATILRRQGIPLIGAGCGVAGCLLHPDWQAYAWLPPLLDLGTLRFIPELPALIRRQRRFLPRERLAEFRLIESAREVTLQLFASGACQLAFTFKPRSRATGLESFSITGCWKVTGGKRSGRRLFLQFDEGERGRYELQADAEAQTLTCTAEQHPLAGREPQTRLTGNALRLSAGKLPKLNSARR